MPGVPERKTHSSEQFPKVEKKAFPLGYEAESGWHQYPQVNLKRGGYPLTPVLQTEAGAQGGLPGALANRARDGPASCLPSIDRLYLQRGLATPLVRSSSLLGTVRSQLPERPWAAL